MTNKWQQQIDQELGNKKWTRQLSNAIVEQAEENGQNRKAPIFIPFISVAMFAIAMLLVLSLSPFQTQNGEQATSEPNTIQQVYYSVLPTNDYEFNVTKNMFNVGVKTSANPKLLQQLSIAFTEKQEVVTADIDYEKMLDVILVDDVGIAYSYKLHLLNNGDIIFEVPESDRLYKYSGLQLQEITALMQKQMNVGIILTIVVIGVMISWIVPWSVLKYYRVKKRKETFDHIILNRIDRWLPGVFYFYVNLNLIFGAESFSWWKIIVPVIIYQLVILWLMNQQKEPKPYIMERLAGFIMHLLLLIGMMIYL